MKKKIILINIIIIIIIIFISVYLIIKKSNIKKENDFIIKTPIKEITEKENRNTIVSIYYYNEENNNYEIEDKIIDVKELIKNPYIILLNLLMDNPRKENLISLIPKNVQINDTYLKNNILYVDFSKEFKEINGYENEKNAIYAIVKTLTQLNEVDGIKILIEGEENQSFLDNNIKFDIIFTKDISK